MCFCACRTRSRICSADWLEREFPDRAKHVMNLLRDTRGGRDNDPNFGSQNVRARSLCLADRPPFRAGLQAS
jgi:hypothetical protein